MQGTNRILVLRLRGGCCSQVEQPFWKSLFLLSWFRLEPLSYGGGCDDPASSGGWESYLSLYYRCPAGVASSFVIGNTWVCYTPHPEVFAACAVTRAGARVAREPDRVNVMEEPLVHLSDFPLSLSHAELVTEQQSDPSIKGLLETVIPVAEVKDQAHGYCLDNGLLVRRWVPCGEFGVGNAIVQIVAPAKFRKMVLQMAHDQSGHMGVRKTYDRILRYFFWPRLKKDVSDYIRTCHTCQITGKPNQVIKPAPLHPISAIGEPFEHIIIDCVGPLPPSRSGASYLLTVMCQATRYPAAYPLRSITTRSVVKALSHFISIFGIPRVVQSDQGSNFSSHMFAQVLKQLRVKHSQSSAYHAQSQGALERFHQTLKSLLRAFCTELDRDWEEGLPWLMLAAREVTQESTGFSPNELVFAHSVRGPLAVLRDGVEAVLLQKTS